MTDNAPKSALELAMERLRQKDKDSNAPDRPLTDEQKAASHEEVEQLNEGLRRDTERMAGERDRKIAAIREGR